MRDTRLLTPPVRTYELIVQQQGSTAGTTAV